MSRRAIGSVYARLTELDYPYYKIDFTTHINLDDSDDEGDDWQWSHAIKFAYLDRQFLNTGEIPYNTVERYTSKTFWKDQSLSIQKMVADTFRVRKARGENTPLWGMAKVLQAAEDIWWKHHNSR